MTETPRPQHISHPGEPAASPTTKRRHPAEQSRNAALAIGIGAFTGIGIALALSGQTTATATPTASGASSAAAADVSTDIASSASSTASSEDWSVTPATQVQVGPAHSQSNGS